ncbi:hypothetical protein BCR44DRAFT_1451289 [Catenaria anguillulae PL171]|uniref:Ankyrin repeat-containing domain protein n=1 Tax=Catenaria anguillulae PL171 TaxID=765915 RepID=A0A1Y2H6U9_9FUNG|nr:hypothetical protein BCR44DRAFT_1451289 [Catenaria anguillulae PL171]
MKLLHAIMSTNAPPLPTDLASPILATCLRLAPPRRLGDAFRVAAVLNALPRSVAPDLSYTAIMLMPWIDTDLACRLGDLWLLNTLHFRLSRPTFSRPVQYTVPGALVGAAAQGYVHVLDWWIENMGEIKCPLTAVLKAACEHGKVAIIQWWLDKGDRQDWSGELIRAASENGHVEMLELFRVNGFDMRCMSGSRCCVAGAVTNGHERVVLWWMKHVGRELDGEEAKNALVAAVILTETDGRCRMLEMLIETLQHHFSAFVASFSCATGDLDFIECCISKAYSGTAHPISYAVASLMGHMHVLDWLHRRAVPIFPRTDSAASDDGLWWAWMSLARRKGQHTVDAFGYDFPDPMSPYFFAVCAGDCRVLDWLHAHDSLRNEKAFAPRMVEQASRGGYIQVLEWLMTHCPQLILSADLLDCIQGATEYGHEHVLGWWKTNVCSSEMLDEAAGHVLLKDAVASGHVVSLNAGDIWQTQGRASVKAKQWWLDHGYPADLVLLISWSTRCGHLDVLRLLHNRDLIRPVLNGQVLKPLHIWRFPDGWDMFNWWMGNYGPECTSRWRQDALQFPNALMAWQSHKNGIGCGEIDGDFASMDGALAVLEWARQAGIRIRHSAPLLWATQSQHLHVLEWWRLHCAQLKPDIPTRTVVLQVCRGMERVVTWWKQSELINE